MALEIQCAYHHKTWRSLTQNVLNTLRGKALSPAVTKIFSSYICVCRGERHRAVSLQETLNNAPYLSKWLQSKPSVLGEAVSATLQRYLTAAAGLDPVEQGFGVVHMVSVVHKAVHGKLDKDEPITEQKQEPKLKKWNLPLSSRYLGFLIGLNGQYIKKLCNEYNVKIYFGKRRQGHYNGQRRMRYYQCYSEGSVLVTIVSCEGEIVDLEKIKSELTARAEYIKERRKIHEETVAKYYMRKEAMRVYRIGNLADDSVIIRNTKETATDIYHHKQHHKKNTKHTSKTSPHSALSGGHCLNCLTPYTSNLTGQGACTFHAGFLIAVKRGRNKGYKWTCCGRRTAEHHPTTDLHTRTGFANIIHWCSSGRHKWRTGKSKSRKEKHGPWNFQDISVISSSILL